MVAPLPKPPEMFQTVNVTRTSSGSYVSGRWVEGGTSVVTITASVQPDRAKPDELLHLPEGDRAREGVRLYTDTDLYTSNETDSTPADLIEWAGEQWEVMRVESWPLHIGHYKVLALRIGRQ